MQSAVDTHVYTIYFFLAIMLFNFYSVSREKDFMTLAKRLRVMTPLYHLTNAIVIYTGTIVAFYAQVMSITIFLMIPASIFLLVIEIKRYKKMRVIKLDNIQAQEEFYKFAKKVYTIEIMVIVSIYIISKVF
ncbi:hypothetical protein [Poseidonibacter sp.]|uniref:hypothetical protein n=1 Tax=Poseidonibacter sp. TaxID=2321188 RepID=UPI00359E7807